MQISPAFIVQTPVIASRNAQRQAAPSIQFSYQALAQDTFQRQGANLRFGMDTPPEPEPREETPLHQATKLGLHERLHHLLHDHHELLEGKDEWGQTPLHVAALVNDLPAVQMLLDHGADIHSTDDNGQNIVHLAAISAAGNGRLATLRYLLKLGLKASAPANDGTTPRELIGFLSEEEGFNIQPVARLLRAYGG